MLRSFGLRDSCLRRNLTTTGQAAEPIVLPQDALWVDLYNPTPQELEAVKAMFGVEAPSKEDMDEIEISSRLYQEDGGTFMTTLVLSKTETDEPECLGVSFILVGERLLTVRYSEPQPFNTFANRAERQVNLWPRAHVILTGLLEAIIDRTADVLEKTGGDVDALSKQIFARNGDAPTGKDYQAILLRLARKNDLTSMARESLISLGRMLAFLSLIVEVKATKEMKGQIKVMTRDVQSLADHTTYLSNKITFLLDAVLGVVNIEQSKIIRILSVAATVFLPPTLLASIWGMNFELMPELKWAWGYAIALVSIVLSAIVPYLIFRWRKWL